jgi:hypothetical protein
VPGMQAAPQLHRPLVVRVASERFRLQHRVQQLYQ